MASKHFRVSATNKNFVASVELAPGPAGFESFRISRLANALAVMLLEEGGPGGSITIRWPDRTDEVAYHGAGRPDGDGWSYDSATDSYLRRVPAESASGE